MNVNLLVQLIRIYKVRAARMIAIPLGHRIQLTRTLAIQETRSQLLRSLVEVVFIRCFRNGTLGLLLLTLVGW